MADTVFYGWLVKLGREHAINVSFQPSPSGRLRMRVELNEIIGARRVMSGYEVSDYEINHTLDGRAFATYVFEKLYFGLRGRLPPT